METRAYVVISDNRLQPQIDRTIQPWQDEPNDGNRQPNPKPEFFNALKLIPGAIDAIAKRVEEIRGEALRDALVAEERLREIERSGERSKRAEASMTAGGRKLKCCPSSRPFLANAKLRAAV